MNFRTYFSRRCQVFLPLTFLCLAAPAWSQEGPTPSGTTADTTQVVQAIERHNEAQARALERYQALRHYSITYKSWIKNITATMDVKLEFDAASGKTFQIVSESGSRTLREKVLKRALESEREAFLNQSATALSRENYKFQLLGSENLEGRPTYILQVEPVSPNPYLYRGKIWVDAADAAVSKMEVQPAKNPSFWIVQTNIHHTSSKVGDFWLPQQSLSETKVRIGGKATLTIDYGPYEISQPSSPALIRSGDSELATAARVPTGR